jgi:Fur family transcriptional regulator, peroxide stress response regulator
MDLVQRNSKQKETILRILKNTTSHPDAEWIYREVKKEIPNVSLGTIYRNLRLLKGSRTIQSVCVSEGIEHFDAKLIEHYHFRCNSCGKIFDLEGEENNALEEKAAARTGFKITGHHLEFNGLCLDCQNQNILKNEKKERSNGKINKR